MVYLFSPYSLVAFYFLGLLSKIAGGGRGQRKLIFIQTPIPDCLFLSGEAEFFDRE